MKTALTIMGLFLFLSGCATMEAPPPEQNTQTAAPTSRDTLSFSSTMEMPRGSSQNAATPSEVTEPAVVVPEKPTKKDIQIALKNAGYYAGGIDGKFGPKTKKAVEEFQTTNNLSVDGVVGPQTWNLLKKYLNLETKQ